MRVPRCLLLAATLWLLPLAAVGQTTPVGGCSGAPSTSKCFIFTNTSAADSALFTLRTYPGKTASYTLIIDASIAVEGAATFQFHLRRCISTPPTHPTNSNLVCEKVLIDQTGDGVKDDTPLTGAPTGSQSIYSLRPGLYYIDVTTAPGAGQTSIVRIDED